MKDILKEIADSSGGDVTVHELKDESGEVVHSFATMSFPLRRDHWIYQREPEDFTVPPMPLRTPSEAEVVISITEADLAKNPGWVGSRTLRLNRRQMADMIRMAGRYAVRCSTMHGTDMDFDPDAMLQNLVVGFLGYWTESGLDSQDAWANPAEEWSPADTPKDPAVPSYSSAENQASNPPPCNPSSGSE